MEFGDEVVDVGEESDWFGRYLIDSAFVSFPPNSVQESGIRVAAVDITIQYFSDLVFFFVIDDYWQGRFVDSVRDGVGSIRL